jgi:hypothetical protein
MFTFLFFVHQPADKGEIPTAGMPSVTPKAQISTQDLLSQQFTSWSQSRDTEAIQQLSSSTHQWSDHNHVLSLVVFGIEQGSTTCK